MASEGRVQQDLKAVPASAAVDTGPPHHHSQYHLRSAQALRLVALRRGELASAGLCGALQPQAARANEPYLYL
jgi:hypothetical protein